MINDPKNRRNERIALTLDSADGPSVLRLRRPLSET